MIHESIKRREFSARDDFSQEEDDLERDVVRADEGSSAEEEREGVDLAQDGRLGDRRGIHLKGGFG